jgi:hypothetical protein
LNRGLKVGHGVDESVQLEKAQSTVVQTSGGALPIERLCKCASGSLERPLRDLQSGKLVEVSATKIARRSLGTDAV